MNGQHSCVSQVAPQHVDSLVLSHTDSSLQLSSVALTGPNILSWQTEEDRAVSPIFHLTFLLESNPNVKMSNDNAWNLHS